jgi:hypothetical protein
MGSWAWAHLQHGGVQRPVGGGEALERGAQLERRHAFLRRRAQHVLQRRHALPQLTQLRGVRRALPQLLWRERGSE